MPTNEFREDEWPEDRRREVFLALADAQELHDFTPAQARQLIASRFGLSVEQARQIEDEGRDKIW